MSYLLRFDGACRGNPGIGGSAAVLFKDNEIIDKCYYYHTKQVTNNITEYYGLIGGLNMCLEKGYTNIFVEGDSKLVIEQIFGKWQCTHENIVPLYNTVNNLKKQFISIYGRWIPREINIEADRYSNIAIDQRNTIGNNWFILNNNNNIKQKTITEFFEVKINEKKNNNIPKKKNNIIKYFSKN